jgi:prepilin-type N-terminal cleavage/methylation domain-containing protein
MPKPRRIRSATSGFTLAEIILVVAVMAILVSLSTPAVMSFLQRRDIQAEENTLVEIAKAMKSYITDRNSMPAVTAVAANCSSAPPNWAVEFSRYSNLSARQIACDTWDRPRAYAMFQRPDTFLGTTIDIFYASVHSSGPNLIANGASASAGGAADSTPGIHINGNNFSNTNAGTTWWHRISSSDDAKIDAFVGMQPAVDDQLIRFTDYADKIEKYKKSLERLDRIAEALESYSRTKYNEAVFACGGSCAPAPENRIFYPRAANPGAPNDSAAYYYSTIQDDLNTYNGGNAIVNAGGSVANHNARREDMINLMRLLGLPDEYCCNALETYTPSTGAKPIEMPFYYFSNPRPRTGPSTCGGRPNPNTGGTLPARLTITLTNACG